MARTIIAIAAFAASTALAQPAPIGPFWTGDLTLTISGAGKLDDGTIKADWSVRRVAKGRILLQRTFRGAGLARSENSGNVARYETWVADLAQPAEIAVDDRGSFYGPIFDPRNFRRDTIRWTCPAPGAAAGAGQVRASILQLDYDKRTATWEAPRIYTACELYFLMEFVKGTPDFAKQPPRMSEQGVDPQFEVVHRLGVPADWTRITVPFAEGQTEIVLSRKLKFEWPLRTEKYRAPLDGELVLVLRKSP